MLNDSGFVFQMNLESRNQTAVVPNVQPCRYCVMLFVSVSHVMSFAPMKILIAVFCFGVGNICNNTLDDCT
jgi:hypothetical protein